VAAYRSHYLEFIPDGEVEAKCIGELQSDHEYTVIVTTGGGLYRYNLHDRVRVDGFYRTLPVLTFTGRNTVSDLVGEKVEERHVRKVVDRAQQQAVLSPLFRLCAPERTTAGAYYVLYIEPGKAAKGGELRARLEILRDETEKGLLENYHYRYAREIGQLAPLKLYTISSGGKQAYTRRCLDQGQRAGDIKPVLLSRRTGWLDAFSGSLLG
jgi:hypothetical protein